MKNGIILIVTLFLGACNPADLSIHLNSRILKSQIIDKCGNNEECKLAVESQFKDCFDKSGYSKLKEFGSHTFDGKAGEALIDEAMRNTYTCIVDEKGNPYFSIKNNEKTE